MEQVEKPDQPILSITVLNYNYAKYLRYCLDSILCQSMSDFEVILINDCSTDDSLKVIQPYLADARIKLVDHPVNKGYVASLNEGCDLSTGRYITVISADDYALDDKAFELACQKMDKNADIALCYSAWHQVDDDGHIHHTRRGSDADYVRSGMEEFRSLLLSSPVLHSGALIRRTAYRKVGGYDKDFRYSVDTNMWLKLCSAGHIAYINQPLYAYRAHATNMSNSLGTLWKATEEMLFGIDTAFARFPKKTFSDERKLHKKAFQRALVAVPTLDIFSNRFKRGWYGYWLAIRHYPVLTFLQLRTGILIMRTILGQKLYDTIRQLVGRRKRLSSEGIS